jgi:hypothetical protein
MRLIGMLPIRIVARLFGEDSAVKACVFRVLVWSLLGASSVLVTSGARADDERTEDELIRQGVDARLRGADANAFALFTRAYALRKSPRAAAQLGLAEVALGRWPEAETHIVESLRANDDGWIKRNTRALQESLDHVRDELGSLRRAAGYRPAARTVQVKPRRLWRESVSLSPQLSSATSKVPSSLQPIAATAPDATVTRPARPPEVPEPSPASPGRGARIAGIVAGGLGAGLVGAGVVLGAKARAAGVDASDASMYDPNAVAAGRRDERLQWIAYGAGAALLTGGVISYVVGTVRGRTTGAGEIGFYPSSSGGVAWLGGAF